MDKQANDDNILDFFKYAYDRYELIIKALDADNNNAYLVEAYANQVQELSILAKDILKSGIDATTSQKIKKMHIEFITSDLFATLRANYFRPNWRTFNCIASFIEETYK